MAGHLELPFHPSTIDCLSWSQDNNIAVTGGESIGILTPRLKEPDTNGSQWDSIVFKANAFTADEVPIVDLLPFNDFSVGEELSTRHVTALKWSSPGLGRYGKSVLAVLSSNHVLSIWEKCGRFDAKDDWKRSVVVNHALRKHYGGHMATGVGENPQRSRADIYGNRVRAFAWSAPVYEDSLPRDCSTPFTDYGSQFLAVSNDLGEVLILSVRSPNDVLCLATVWRIEVIHSFNVHDLLLQMLDLDSSGDAAEQLPPVAGDTYIVDHLAWGPARNDDSAVQRSTLAFITRGRLFCAAVDIHSDDTVIEASLVDSRCHEALSRSDLTGPISFIPATQSVIAFGADVIVCVDTSRSFNDDKCSTTHHLDGRWDEISGAAFSDSPSDTIQAHFISTLSSADSSTSALSLPLDMDEVSVSPAWQRALINLRTQFKAKHKLPGGVQERVWGMASSPMGDLIATATVLLPSEAVAYLQPGELRTHITITRQPLPENTILPVDAGISSSSDISSALLLFSLAACTKGCSKTADVESLLAAMQECVRLPDGMIKFDPDVDMSTCMERKKHARYLRLRLFLMPEIRETRFRLLAAMAKRGSQNTDKVTKEVTSSLTREVLKIPIRFAQASDLSRRIHSIYLIIKSKLESSSSSESTDTSDNSNEECIICKKAIVFESVKWARCTKGHQFVRCGLTFLAIQQPGMTKTCGICGTQFIDEWKLDTLKNTTGTEGDVAMGDAPNDNAQTNGDTVATVTDDEDWIQLSLNKAGAEPEESLARILFAAFDHCVYCGGNF